MLSTAEIVSRLVIATILGSLVGLERERLDRGAGMRTHALVCVGSALMMIVSGGGFRDFLGRHDIVLDPSRVAAQVVSGIGFLGAGIIFRRERVRGLTTAASVWVVAGVGLAVGGGLYIAAVCVIILALLVLAVLKPIEARIMDHWRPRTLTLWTSPKLPVLYEVRTAVEGVGAQISEITLFPSCGAERDRVELALASTRGVDMTLLAETVRRIGGIQEARLGSTDRASIHGASEQANGKRSDEED